MPSFEPCPNSQLLEQIIKAAQRRWQRYPDTYRAPELRTIASWINKGESGCVVGLPGIGRSTLLGFLYHRPKVLAKYLTIPSETVAVIPIDLNILPDDTIATVYRVILRAFYRARGQFDDPLGVLGAKGRKCTLSLNQIAVAASQTMQHHPQYQNEIDHNG